MKITVELDIEDTPIENRIPTEEEKRTRSCGWFQCGRCNGTVFHSLKRIPLEWNNDGKMQHHPFYNANDDQSAVALLICMQCKKLVWWQ